MIVRCSSLVESLAVFLEADVTTETIDDLQDSLVERVSTAESGLQISRLSSQHR